MKNKRVNNDVQFQKWIIHKLQNRFCNPEEELISQGRQETLSGMFILAKGECEVLVSDQHKEENFVQYLSPGDIFGEVALIFNTVRTATVRTRNYVTVAEVGQELFQQVRLIFPGIIKRMRDGTSNYQDQWKMFLKRKLIQVDYLRDTSDLEEIVYSFKIQHFDMHQYLLKPGDEIDTINFLIEGELEISFTINDINLERFKQKYSIDPDQLNDLIQLRASQIKARPDQEHWLLSENLFKNISNLKEHVEMLPLIENGLVANSCQPHQLKQTIFQHKNLLPLGENCQEIIINSLGQGAVLSMYSILIANQFKLRHLLNAKTQTPCTMYQIPSPVLFEVALKLPMINKAIENVRTKLFFWDNERAMYLSKEPKLDYIACLSEDTDVERVKSLECRRKFKEGVIKQITKNRVKAYQETPQICNLIRNIRKYLAQKEGVQYKDREEGLEGIDEVTKAQVLKARDLVAFLISEKFNSKLIDMQNVIENLEQMIDQMDVHQERISQDHLQMLTQIDSLCGGLDHILAQQKGTVKNKQQLGLKQQDVQEIEQQKEEEIAQQEQVESPQQHPVAEEPSLSNVENNALEQRPDALDSEQLEQEQSPKEEEMPEYKASEFDAQDVEQNSGY